MSADRPALEYARITREVDAIVRRHSGNDLERAAYLVARAALLIVRGSKGSRVAAEKAFQLADELCDAGRAP